MNEEKQLQAITYQDGVMKKKFEQYPEIIFADTTYKKKELNFPVTFIIVVDGIKNQRWQQSS
jgi:hypothetical protein